MNHDPLCRIWSSDEYCSCLNIAEARKQAIRDCIAATEAEMQRNGWDETTIHCTTQPMRALLEGTEK